MLLRPAGSEMDDGSMKDSKRLVLRSGLIICAMLVVGAMVSQSASSGKNPVLRSFVANTRPLVSSDIRAGTKMTAQLYSNYKIVVGIYFTNKAGTPNRCTGVLLTKTKVLTAGHCCDSAHTEAHSVVSGISMDDPVKTWKIKELEVFHKSDGEKFKYDPTKKDTSTPLYDLCMITLETAVGFDVKVALPGSSPKIKPIFSKNYYMVGYGRIGSSDAQKNDDWELYWAKGKPIACENKFQWAGTSWNTAKNLVFCAYGKEAGHNACSGDSGGPFLDEPGCFSGQRTVYGILSDGQKPCKDGANSYTDLSKKVFSDWIKEKIKD